MTADDHGMAGRMTSQGDYSLLGGHGKDKERVIVAL